MALHRLPRKPFWERFDHVLTVVAVCAVLLPVLIWDIYWIDLLLRSL